MTRHQRNEKTKLTAAFFNNLTVGIFALGLVGPFVKGFMGEKVEIDFMYIGGVVGVAIAFHFVARSWLYDLEEE